MQPKYIPSIAKGTALQMYASKRHVQQRCIVGEVSQAAIQEFAIPIKHHLHLQFWPASCRVSLGPYP